MGDGGVYSSLGAVFTGNGVWASKYCDESGLGCVDAPISSGGGGSVPSGAVMFFNISSCPSGWTELTTRAGASLRVFLRAGLWRAQKGRRLPIWARDRLPMFHRTTTASTRQTPDSASTIQEIIITIPASENHTGQTARIATRQALLMAALFIRVPMVLTTTPAPLT